MSDSRNTSGVAYPQRTLGGDSGDAITENGAAPVQGRTACPAARPLDLDILSGAGPARTPPSQFSVIWTRLSRAAPASGRVAIAPVSMPGFGAPSELMYHELGAFGSLGPVTED